MIGLSFSHQKISWGCFVLLTRTLLPLPNNFNEFCNHIMTLESCYHVKKFLSLIMKILSKNIILNLCAILTSTLPTIVPNFHSFHFYKSVESNTYSFPMKPKRAVKTLDSRSADWDEAQWKAARRHPWVSATIRFGFQQNLSGRPIRARFQDLDFKRKYLTMF